MCKAMRTRLLTVSQLLAAHPKITENQLRYALRNRRKNGLKNAIFRPRVGHAFLFDEQQLVAWLNARVPA